MNSELIHIIQFSFMIKFELKLCNKSMKFIVWTIHMHITYKHLFDYSNIWQNVGYIFSISEITTLHALKSPHRKTVIILGTGKTWSMIVSYQFIIILWTCYYHYYCLLLWRCDNFGPITFFTLGYYKIRNFKQKLFFWIS